METSYTKPATYAGVLTIRVRPGDGADSFADDLAVLRRRKGASGWDVSLPDVDIPERNLYREGRGLADDLTLREAKQLCALIAACRAAGQEDYALLEAVMAHAGYAPLVAAVRRRKGLATPAQH